MPARAPFLLTALICAACALGSACTPPRSGALTFSGSALGREGELLQRQLARFTAEHAIPVVLQPTPDSANQRHQLYVQWLNAHASEPDVLQLDVVWTPEFAAAGWILPLDGYGPSRDDYFAASMAANTWRGTLYAIPWFVDVGMLYWRTDLLPRAPESFDELREAVRQATDRASVRDGFVWQGARYEGLVTVFVEHLAGFGGAILDDTGAVAVDSAAAVAALEWMHRAIHADGVVPRAVLTWQEEETRFAFQNGTAVLMRNWPYAVPLLQSGQSRVAGRFGLAPMPAAAGGAAGAALGGAQLAINARSGRVDEAWALIEYLTAPAQMLERAEFVGQYPARPAVYDAARLRDALGADPAGIRDIIDRAVPRPVTPVYTQLSEILQIRLHRALTGQQDPRAALQEAAREMRALLERTGLAPSPGPVGAADPPAPERPRE